MLLLLHGLYRKDCNDASKECDTKLKKRPLRSMNAFVHSHSLFYKHKDQIFSITIP